jgi:hypothetical protein
MVFISRRAARAGAIQDQTGRRGGLVPKVLKRSPLEIFKKCMVP